MSAYKDSKLGTWYVKFRCKDWKGDTRWITKRGFATKREATQWEKEYSLRNDGDLTMSFAAFLKVYESDQTPRVKESTMLLKKRMHTRDLIPAFGSKSMCDITVSDIVQWQNEHLIYRDENGKPYAPAYLKSLHNQLSAVFSHAVRYYGLQSNPAKLAGNMGSDRGEPMKFWTQEEYEAFSNEVKDDPLVYCCFAVLYWCGLRKGELLALTLEDFNFDKKTVSISKTYSVIHGKATITPPKTLKSNRTIVMPDFLCRELQGYFEEYSNIDLGERAFPVSGSFLYTRLKKGAKRAGVKTIRIHDLRHAHVSLLIHLGFGAVAIADRLGHESISVTYRYAHLFPSVQLQMADRLDALNNKVGD